MSKRIIIIRHAETTWNTPRRRIQGKGRDDEIVLTENGKKQISVKLAHLNIPDLLITSPLLRCKQTAEVWFGISFAKIKLPIVIRDDLREIDVGQFEGKYVDELTGENKKMWQVWRSNPLLMHAFPDGEKIIDFRNRVLCAFSDICQKYIHRYTNIVIISHGGPMRVLRCFQEGKDLSHFWDHDVDNLDYIELSTEEIRRLCLSTDDQKVVT